MRVRVPRKLLEQTAAEPVRFLPVHGRDGALDSGGLRVREGVVRYAPRAGRVAASVGGVVGIGIVLCVAVARPKSVVVIVVRILYPIPGLPVCVCVTRTHT